MEFTDNEVMELSNLVLKTNDHDVAWYDLGSDRHIDLEKVAEQANVSNIENIEVKHTHFIPPKSFLEKLLNSCLGYTIPGYTLKVKNPKKIPAHIDTGRKNAAIYSIISYNAGNVEHAGIHFNDGSAFVDPKYKQLVESRGFKHYIPERLYKHEIILKPR